LVVPDDLAETRSPTREELAIIRNVLDPDTRRAGDVAERAPKVEGATS
jgi:hypothetical protein